MTISWAEDYQPVVYSFFMMGVNMIPSVIPALYNVQTSNSAFEYFLGLEGTDVEGWNVYKDTGISAYADFDDWMPREAQSRLCMWPDYLLRKRIKRPRVCRELAVVEFSGDSFAFCLCDRHAEDFRDERDREKSEHHP